MKKWVEKKNCCNDYTYIVFGGVLSGRYKIKGWCFSPQAGDKVTYKAQQIGDQIWLSIIAGYGETFLLKRIPCGFERLSNEQIYNKAIKYL